MEFTEGNKLWQNRLNSGRKYFFKTPDAMWEAACGYFQWCDDHPILKCIGGGPRYQPDTYIPKLRAYTLQGLCYYLGCTDKYFNHFEKGLEGKTDEVSEEYLRILSMIRNVIYEQKFTAAAAGELNPSLIARELNLFCNNTAAILDNTDTEPKKPRSVIVWGEHEIPI